MGTEYILEILFHYVEERMTYLIKVFNYFLTIDLEENKVDIQLIWYKDKLQTNEKTRKIKYNGSEKTIMDYFSITFVSIVFPK